MREWLEMSEMLRTKRIAGYIRVSTLEQANNGYSLKMQKDEIDKWAKENNCIIHDYYIDDGYTATNMKRPELQRMLDESEHFDLVVFIKLDRFVRKVPHYYKIMERLDETKTAWKTIFEEYDTTTQDGQFMINIYLSMAQKEAALASERTKAVFKNRLENGECIISNLPRGYKREKINGKWKMVIDEESAPLVRGAFRHMKNYASVRGTLTYIRDEFGVVFQPDSLRAILKNPLYIGTYTHTEYGTFEDFAPPLISKGEFYAIQEILEKNRKHYPNKSAPRFYVFSGMLRCSCCGGRLAGKKGGTPNAAHRYYCYRAATYYDCDMKSYLSAKNIEDYLLANVRDLLAEKIVTYEVEQQKNIDPTKKLKRQLAKLEEKMDELTDMKIAKQIRPAKYEKDFRALESQAAEIEAELSRISISAETFDISVYKSFLEQDFETQYHTLTPEDKRRLWLSVVRYIVADKEKVEPVFF